MTLASIEDREFPHITFTQLKMSVYIADIFLLWILRMFAFYLLHKNGNLM